MEKVKQETEVFENDIQLYLSMFCEENNIDDLFNIPQSTWTAGLRYIYKHVFQGTTKLKRDTPLIGNGNIVYNIPDGVYDYDKVNYVLDIYIYDMCLKYNKEISMIGFSALTGIGVDLICAWGNGYVKLSHTPIEIYEKLRSYREESLSNKLVDGKRNPVGTIAVLNRQFGWASPYTADSNRQKSAPLTAEQLPKLNVNDKQLEDKSNTQFTNNSMALESPENGHSFIDKDA